jgi:hypothetical protein
MPSFQVILRLFRPGANPACRLASGDNLFEEVLDESRPQRNFCESPGYMTARAGDRYLGGFTGGREAGEADFLAERKLLLCLCEL